ncbi:glycosyltransferase 87 family protein [Aquipuribacter nitratireducens]|uniref:Glycosyltransferase 87 family protein n=1 Tax=Aquipuribacter nitratireducens TaxID=650104 RepID=A0ABW0GVT5_9MICO
MTTPPAQPARRHTVPLLILGWVAARVLMVVLYAADDFVGRSLAWGDLALYEFWAQQIRDTGAMPDGVTWMYPPLAAPVLLLADALPGSFGSGFVLLVLAADLAVLALLLRAVVREGGHRTGAWAWVVLVPLLGLIAWARLDLLPVAAAAGALLLAAARPVLAGVLAALGTAVKAWPVVLGLLFLRERRWLAGAVGAGLLLALVLTLLLDDAWGFVANLSGRGIQVESVLALPWTLQQALGGTVDGDFVNGTYEVLEPGTEVLAVVAPLLMVTAVGAGLWSSRHRAPALRWYVAVTALLATSPLLSTQFVLWLVGGAAVAAVLPGRDGDLARRTLPLVGVVVLLSHLTFPLQWGGLVGDGQLAAWTLLTRNVLLLALAGRLLVTARGGAAHPAPEALGQPQRGTGSPDSSAASR